MAHEPASTQESGVPGGAAVVHAQPSAATYIKLAVILAVITIVEVGVYYIESLGDWITSILVVLSALKFSLVIMYYMHLKTDARLLSAVFLWGLFVAASIIMAMMAIFTAF